MEINLSIICCSLYSGSGLGMIFPDFMFQLKDFKPCITSPSLAADWRGDLEAQMVRIMD